MKNMFLANNVHTYINQPETYFSHDSSLFLDRGAHHIAPFGPGTIIVAHSRIPKQAGQHKPRMCGTLPNTTIGNHIFIRRYIFTAIDSSQIFSRFEGAICVSSSRPGNAFSAWNMSTTLRPFLGIVDHVDELARILLGGSHIDQSPPGVVESASHIITECANRLINWLG